jgi:hypothetical protein
MLYLSRARVNKTQAGCFRVISSLAPFDAMPSSRSKQIEVPTIVAITQAAVGCGIGLLVANRFQSTARKIAGWVMVSLGVASATPLVVGYFARAANGPGSARAMRRRLDSIRQDSGFSENADVF